MKRNVHWFISANLREVFLAVGVSLFLFPENAHGQTSPGALTAEKPSQGVELNSDPGLKSATPTDDISEFESNTVPDVDSIVKKPPSKTLQTAKQLPKAVMPKISPISTSSKKPPTILEPISSSVSSPKSSPTPSLPQQSPAPVNPGTTKSSESLIVESPEKKQITPLPAAAQAVPVQNAVIPIPAKKGEVKNTLALPEGSIKKKETPKEIINELPERPVMVPPMIISSNNFSGAPAMPGGLRWMAEGEAPEVYHVEYGDTLFDICDQLLDEPGYWPKLWSMNPEIKNPHFIYPGMKLEFYPGDKDNPPYLQVLNESDIVPIDKGEISEKELVASKDIVEVEMSTLPPLKGFEIVDMEDLSVGQQALDSFEAIGEYVVRDEETLFVPGFIYAEEQVSFGTIGGGIDGEILVGQNDQVIIESPEGTVAVGSRYKIARGGHEVRHPKSRDFIGYLYYYVASVFIEKQLEDESRNLFLGRVSESRTPVEQKDLLLTYGSSVRIISPISAIGLINSTDGTVVALANINQDIDGSGGFVFLDRGIAHGIAIGQFFEVQKNYGVSWAQVEQVVPDKSRRPVGIIRIIDVTDVGAAGYIVKNERPIEIGDVIGKGN